MTPFWQTVHWLSVGVNLAGLGIFGWAYSVMGSPGWLWFMAWCALNGGLSTYALRKPGIAA